MHWYWCDPGNNVSEPLLSWLHIESSKVKEKGKEKKKKIENSGVMSESR